VNEANRLYVSTREDWRQWLTENYLTASQVWLVYPRKASGMPRIPYHEAVEEALCFGWIDSTTKSVDELRFSQRFTPRKPGSAYSQANIERLRRLVPQGKVMPEVLSVVQSLLEEEFVFPTDIEAALRANESAWANFQRYPDPYRRIRVAYVEGARNRPGEFEKRLRNLVRMSELDKQFGFGIEDFYDQEGG
jgi:uncharacterized protein YdeI (YjbR/CyaY-like superfamily)